MYLGQSLDIGLTVSGYLEAYELTDLGCRPRRRVCSFGQGQA